MLPLSLYRFDSLGYRGSWSTLYGPFVPVVTEKFLDRMKPSEEPLIVALLVGFRNLTTRLVTAIAINYHMHSSYH